MLPNLTNLSPEVLQNLFKLIGQNQGQIQNIIQNRAQSVPASTTPETRAAQIPQPQQNTPTSSLANNVLANRSGSNSNTSSIPKVSGFRPQTQNQQNTRPNNFGSNPRAQQENRIKSEDMLQFSNNNNKDDREKQQPRFGAANGGRGFSSSMIKEEVDQDAVTVLMVAEKPSIAKAIAEALAPGRPRSRKGNHTTYSSP